MLAEIMREHEVAVEGKSEAERLLVAIWHVFYCVIYSERFGPPLRPLFTQNGARYFQHVNTKASRSSPWQ